MFKEHYNTILKSLKDIRLTSKGKQKPKLG